MNIHMPHPEPRGHAPRSCQGLLRLAYIALLLLPLMADAQTALAPASTANPYGLAALWHSADLLARLVMLILLVMSGLSWYLLLSKWLTLARMQQQQTHLAGFWAAPTVAQGLATLPAGCAYHQMAQAGLRATQSAPGLLGQVAAQERVGLALSQGVEATARQLQSGLSWLATVGSVAPFVGLFGTVWGIYHALVALGIATQASLDQVAGPVGEALLMTAMGLAVAVPAVLAYNWLLQRNKLVLQDLRQFAGELHAVLTAQITPR